MKTLQLGNNLTWVGVQDPNLRVFDIIMETKQGTSYNSYILQGTDKNVLFETAKVQFIDDYLRKVESILPISEIDYIVVNHTEPDHAGSIERILQTNPSIQIIGTVTALNFLKEIVNSDFKGIAVKDNEVISIGDKTLRFMHNPNLHWPDTMFTYIEEDQTLITCDCFGAHFSFDGVLASKLVDRKDYMESAEYYFDCIMSPFKPFVLKALDKIEPLKIKLICTGHGPILDTGIEEILAAYKTWATPNGPFTSKTVVIAYVSAYGYTKKLAEKIEEGIRACGEIEVVAYDLEKIDKEKVIEACLYAEGILLGTPTILQDALKPIWDLTTEMFIQTHRDKLAGSFGSYGWSGEGCKNISERLKQLRMKVVDPFTVRFNPSANQLEDAFEYGYNFGCILLSKTNEKEVSK